MPGPGVMVATVTVSRSIQTNETVIGKGANAPIWWHHRQAAIFCERQTLGVFCSGISSHCHFCDTIVSSEWQTPGSHMTAIDHVGLLVASRPD
jgi:hypothetical protein